MNNLIDSFERKIENIEIAYDFKDLQIEFNFDFIATKIEKAYEINLINFSKYFFNKRTTRSQNSQIEYLFDNFSNGAISFKGHNSIKYITYQMSYNTKNGIKFTEILKKKFSEIEIKAIMKDIFLNNNSIIDKMRLLVDIPISNFDNFQNTSEIKFTKKQENRLNIQLNNLLSNTIDKYYTKLF